MRMRRWQSNLFVSFCKVKAVGKALFSIQNQKSMPFPPPNFWQIKGLSLQLGPPAFDRWCHAAEVLSICLSPLLLSTSILFPFHPSFCFWLLLQRVSHFKFCILHCIPFFLSFIFFFLYIYIYWFVFLGVFYNISHQNVARFWRWPYVDIVTWFQRCGGDKKKKRKTERER